MPDVLTPKQILFTDNLFKGMTQREAWLQAGYSGRYEVSWIDSHACRLAGLDKVKTRLAELQSVSKSLLIADEIERKEILSEISRGKLSQFTDDAGIIDRSKLDSSAIQGIDEQTVMGKRATVIKLRLHNPIQAIAELNKMEKVYETPQAQDNRVFNIIVMDKETKELLLRVGQGERTGKLIEEGVIDAVQE